jgi:hypothetical protein
MTSPPTTEREDPELQRPSGSFLAGARIERARIVAWLRKEADETFSRARRDNWRDAADAIERQEHPHG